MAMDGSGGVLIAENSDPLGAYRTTVNYGEYIEFETRVMLSVEEAVPQILDCIGS